MLLQWAPAERLLLMFPASPGRGTDALFARIPLFARNCAIPPKGVFVERVTALDTHSMFALRAAVSEVAVYCRISRFLLQNSMNRYDWLSQIPPCPVSNNFGGVNQVELPAVKNQNPRAN